MNKQYTKRSKNGKSLTWAQQTSPGKETTYLLFQEYWREKDVFTVERTEVKETQMDFGIVIYDNGHAPLSIGDNYLLFLFIAI